MQIHILLVHKHLALSFPDGNSVVALHQPRAWKLALANTITLSAVILMALNLERLLWYRRES